MSDEIQQTRYDRLIRRVAGIIGPGSKVGTVVTELLPVLDVESVPGELLKLAGTQLGFGGGRIVGAAAQCPAAMVRNPDESGLLITVTDIYLSTSTGAITRFLGGLQTAALTGGVSTQIFRDTRDFSPNLPTGAISQESAVALGGATIQFRTLSDANLHIHAENGICVLQPGWGIRFAADVAASSMTYSFFWRERPAQQSELLA